MSDTGYATTAPCAMRWQKLRVMWKMWKISCWLNDVKTLGDGVITVTEDAKKVLKTVLITAEAGPDEGLRLLPTPDGKFVLAIDTELSGDQVVEYEGFRVLLVGIEYHRDLEGRTVDCQYTKGEPILFVR